MTSAALSSFRLDIVSDTICPWCYVGKRRLAAALPILEAEGLTLALSHYRKLHAMDVSLRDIMPRRRLRATPAWLRP
jgi:predicted DsbA family dithiol-disulfide isomerase